MKKIISRAGSKLSLLALMTLSFIVSNAQIISSTTYPCTATSGNSLASFTSISTLISSGSDDGNSALTNIGFDFWFNGVRYTQFGVNANGIMKLGSVMTGTNSRNNLENGAQDPKIAPFWDNLTTGSNGYVKYGLNGTAPNRSLVVEWKVNAGSNLTNPAGIIFQTILYEGTGIIQFIYDTAIPSGLNYSIGFSSSKTNMASVQNSTNTVTYGSDPNTGQSTAIASEKALTFIPIVPIAPTNLTFSSITATSISLNWADNANNEVGYVIYSSTDNVNFTFNKQIAANSTTTTISGLTQDTPYYFKVYAVTEGALSTALTNSATTKSQKMNVQGNSLSILNGDTVPSISDGTDFGAADIFLASISKTFTIQNKGTSALTISNITVTGTNSGEFTVTTSPASSVAAGSSTTFVVTFNPTAVFTRTATINIFSDDTNQNPYSFAIQGTGLVDNDSDGIDNNADQDDDNDGIIDVVECGTCISDPFVNGNFETPVIGPSTYAILPTSNVTGWQTSAENFIEIWSSGFSSTSGGPVTAASGNQFAELNANVPGTLYQTFCLNGAGGTINWSIKHRGRSGSDTAYVRFGVDLAAAQTSAPIAVMVDGNTAWGSYSGTYNIPVGQTQIILAFIAGTTASGSPSIGNFIDDVQIVINQNCVDSDNDGIADVVDVDSDNDGIPDIEEAGFKNYSNHKSVMDRSSSATWVDANSNGVNDFIDTQITANTYSILDSDGDSVPNYLDLDSDNDTFFDVDEAGLFNGDADINGDGKGDLLDAEGDGLLDFYDDTALFGSVSRPYAQDTDSDGIPDYLDLDSNNDGIKDIHTGLYGNLDTSNDGKVNGSTDADKDGLFSTFDTNDNAKGSPRDLDRKLFLDFDGRNDYAENTAIFGGYRNVSLMAWIDLNNTFSSDGVIVGQDKFQIRITSAKKLEAVVNSTVLTYDAVTLNTAQWYHVAAVFGGGFLKLYLNGALVTSTPATGSIATDTTKLTLGKNPSGTNNYFKGKIDEVRVFNVALTDIQVQRMVYQEIQNTNTQVRGTVVPKDIQSLPFANLLRYYRMDVFKDDITDDLTTVSTDIGTGMKMYNHKIINVQQAPMPFITLTNGNLATAVNNPANDVRGLDVDDYNYSIIQVKHNITQTNNNTHLAMFVDPGVTINMNNDTKLQNDWYLKLDGKIDLAGKSQLIQSTNSDLEVTSSGFIERDQQGEANFYNYNYWSSPVSTINNTTINHGYTVDEVMKDGTTSTPQNLNWTTSRDGSPTSPITLSTYWIYKLQDATGDYSDWFYVGQNGTLLAGQGFTLKGSGSAAANQNYTFVGKPNNGTITSSVAADNLNLCGNPYPSAIEADKFIDDNLVSTDGSLYFWEHYNTNNTHITRQYQGGYATYTKVGGTPPIAPIGISGLGSSSKTPKRFIPVGQGFFVNGSSTGGTITFNNSQRLFIKEEDTESFTMFKTKSTVVENPAMNNKPDSYSESEKFMKIRLGYNTNNDYHRQILLGFMNQYATPEFDRGYDAFSIDSLTNDMYFVNGENQLNIQGVGYFNANNIYPLGVMTDADGTISFDVDETENFDQNQDIFIYDNETEIYHNIKSEKFEIDLPEGTYDDRFSLRFSEAADDSSLTNNNFHSNNEINVAYSNTNNILNIKNNLTDTTVEKVIVYNVLGQMVSSFDIKEQDQSNIQLPVKNLSTGTYIINIKTDKGTTAKKIVFN